MIARQLQYGEKIPFQHGLEPLIIDYRWAWVAVDNGTIVGLLLCAPCHGAALLVRLIGTRGAPVTWVRQVLTTASRDLIERGYRVAFVYFSLDNPAEVRLAKLLMRHGKDGRKGVLGGKHILCVTAVEDWAHGQ